MKVPEGVSVEVQKGKVIVSKGDISLSEIFPSRIVSVKLNGNDLTVEPLIKKRKYLSISKAVSSQIANLIEGLNRPFEKKMVVLHSHFPVSLEIKDKKIYIANFLGERKKREADIVGDTTVKISKDEIVVSGPNKKHVGQTAANLISATKIKGKDERIFQDGIYLVR